MGLANNSRDLSRPVMPLCSRDTCLESALGTLVVPATAAVTDNRSTASALLRQTSTSPVVVLVLLGLLLAIFLPGGVKLMGLQKIHRLLPRTGVFIALLDKTILQFAEDGSIFPPISISNQLVSGVGFPCTVLELCLGIIIGGIDKLRLQTHKMVQPFGSHLGLHDVSEFLERRHILGQGQVIRLLESQELGQSVI